VTEEMKNNGGNTEKGYSVIQVILGVIMLVMGMKYLPPSDDPSSAAATISEGRAAANTRESDPCPNGAAHYLYVAGITILAANLVNIVSKIAQHLAEKDGEVTDGEKCGLGLLTCVSSILVVVDLCMILWGSVVVFGAWAFWTSDYKKYAEDPEWYNFCEYPPMVTALVILIFKWILIPLMIMLVCCCTFLCSCCAMGLTFLGLKAASQVVQEADGKEEA